jgi:hypothetical protein
MNSQEIEAPYSCSLVAPDPMMLAIAAGKVRHAINVWRECMAANRWLAYSPQVHYAEPAPWEIANAELMGYI